VVNQIIARSTRIKYGKNARIRRGIAIVLHEGIIVRCIHKELVSIAVPAELKAMPARGLLDD
jgi:hypothetical protein